MNNNLGENPIENVQDMNNININNNQNNIIKIFKIIIKLKNLIYL